VSTNAATATNPKLLEVDDDPVGILGRLLGMNAGERILAIAAALGKVWAAVSGADAVSEGIRLPPLRW
jgi:hypothetical protein